MLELKERDYTAKELEDFKREVLENKNRDNNYLLENIQALRLLGWQIKLGTRFSHEYMVEFYDVLRFDSQLKPKAMRLHIPKKPTVKCPDCRDGKVIETCACKGMIGNVCQYCNGDWRHAKVNCRTCNGTRRVEKLKEQNNE